MTLWARISVFVACFAAIPVVSFGAEEPGTYPVWWSSEIELESLDRVDERLDRPFWPDRSGLKMYQYEEGQTKPENPVYVNNCRELMELRSRGYDGWGYTTHKLMLRMFATCRGIEMMKRARPARVGYTRNFQLNEESQDYLSWMLSPPIKLSLVCVQLAINARRVPWSLVDKAERVEITSAQKMVVYTAWWADRLTILARADFDEDGLEDILILNSNWATDGNYGNSDIFLITRDSPDGVFWVLEAESHLNPEFPCVEHDGNDTLFTIEDKLAVPDTRPLVIENVEKIDQRLERPFWPVGRGIEVYKHVRGQPKQNPVKVNNCRALLDFRDEGYDGWGQLNHNRMLRLLSTCRGIELMKRAQPARTSYVREFTLDVMAPDFLPWMVLQPRKAEQVCFQIAVNELRVRWYVMTTDLWAEYYVEDNAKFHSPARLDVLTILARADFNGDGLEDILIVNNNWVDEGTYSNSDIFLITRDSTDGVFWVLEPESHLKAGVRCDKGKMEQFIRQLRQ